MSNPPAGPRVVAVCRDGEHRFSKVPVAAIAVIEGFGVEGDAHAGATVQHVSRVSRDPTTPNLRQVHLIHEGLLDEARDAGHAVGPGSLGENVLTRGIDLLGLSRDTRLHIGEVVLVVTGLRNPCRQINDFSAGLLKVCVERADGVATDSDVDLGPTGGSVSRDGQPIRRKAGIMTVVERGGVIRPGDPITVEAPSEHVALEPV